MNTFEFWLLMFLENNIPWNKFFVVNIVDYYLEGFIDVSRLESKDLVKRFEVFFE